MPSWILKRFLARSYSPFLVLNMDMPAGVGGGGGVWRSARQGCAGCCRAPGRRVRPARAGRRRQELRAGQRPAAAGRRTRVGRQAAAGEGQHPAGAGHQLQQVAQAAAAVGAARRGGGRQHNLGMAAPAKPYLRYATRAAGGYRSSSTRNAADRVGRCRGGRCAPGGPGGGPARRAPTRDRRPCACAGRISCHPPPPFRRSSAHAAR
jgi:hypothetical protein